MALSKQQLKAIHAKKFLPVAIIEKPGGKSDIFFKSNAMTEKSAFHDAAKKSFIESQKPEYKKGTLRFAVALNKNKLGALRSGKKFTRTNAFLIAEKAGKNKEKLVARKGPIGEKPEVIVGKIDSSKLRDAKGRPIKDPELRKALRGRK